jgi:hypothetical protein
LLQTNGNGGEIPQLLQTSIVLYSGDKREEIASIFLVGNLGHQQGIVGSLYIYVSLAEVVQQGSCKETIFSGELPLPSGSNHEYDLEILPKDIVGEARDIAKGPHSKMLCPSLLSQVKSSGTIGGGEYHSFARYPISSVFFGVIA